MENEKRTGTTKRTGNTEYVWSARNGAELKVVIKIELTNYEDIAYADGDNIYLGQKNMIRIEKEAYMDGAKMGSGEKTGANPEEAKSGIVGGVGKIGYTEATKKEISKLVQNKIEELKKDFVEFLAQEKIDNEKKAKKEAFEKADAEQYAKDIKNGMCPKCGTYCYGDCEAN